MLPATTQQSAVTTPAAAAAAAVGDIDDDYAPAASSVRQISSTIIESPTNLCTLVLLSHSLSLIAFLHYLSD